MPIVLGDTSITGSGIINEGNLTAAANAGRLLGIAVLGPWAISGDLEVAAARQQSGSTATWTRPAGCNNVLVYVTGGGGGGQKSSNNSYRGSGGGGGGTAIKWISNVTSTVSYTIGGGGAGVYSGTNASAGGSSSFGSYCTAFGGLGGSDNGTFAYTARGGGATGGDLNIPGGGSSFNHSVGSDGPLGGMSFWTQSGGRHRPSGDGYGTAYVNAGRWGSGGANGPYDESGISGQQVIDGMSGGAGVIVIYLYS
jgi:hypothetical protein